MADEVPELLLRIPAPVVDPQFIHNGTVHLSVTQREKLTAEYNASVSHFLSREGLCHADAVVPSVSFALRLFNAENFSGELSPSEWDRYRSVLERFCTPRHSAATADRADSDETRAAQKQLVEEDGLREAFLRQLLTTDGEVASPCVRLSGLLLCAVAIVTATVGEPDEATPLVPCWNIWRLRTTFRHQLCLTHRVHSLFVRISECIDAIMSQPNEALTVEQLLEVGHAQNYYHHRELAAQSLRRAEAMSGLQLEESAVMGVRTRWQQHKLVQMVLTAKSTREIPEESTEEEQPKSIMTEKDGHDLLDRPREAVGAEPLALSPLHPEDKALILALSTDILNNNPHFGLTQHHILTYVERLLVDPAASPFMIRSQMLLMKARLEGRRSRVQERAYLQMCELVDQFSSARDPTRPHFGRTQSEYMYSVAYPPIWALKTEFGDICYEENLFKTALDLYEQVLDWEKIILCCKKLDKRKRAESLARELLEKDPHNPMLWVALGEATREDAHLWKAWELCEHKMAAPMRSLAKLALEREHYEDVLRYFDESVRVNPVFGGDWFSLGYASLKLQRWDRGGEAFTRVCQINPNDAFAWNNLGSILLREGQLRPAFNAMGQALRNNRRNWRMWQNYFEIGCQLKEVFETTNALNVALDIAKRQIHFEKHSLERFVENAIAYMEGTISGSSQDAEETDGAMIGVVNYRSMTSGEPVASDLCRPAMVSVEDDEENADAYADLTPFGADDAMPSTFCFARQETAEKTAIAQAIRLRYAARVRTLFLRLTDMFVTDPDLYASAAKLFGYLDGPLAAFYYRQKELRACEQKDQWQRVETLFARTVVCLQSMVEDCLCALNKSMAEMEQPYIVTEANAEAVTSTALSEKREEASPTSHFPAIHGPALQEKVLGALKQAQNDIKAVVEAAEEHMEGCESYSHVRALFPRVRSAVQEAKSSFCL